MIKQQTQKTTTTKRVNFEPESPKKFSESP